MSEFLKKYKFIYDVIKEDMATAQAPLEEIIRNESKILEYGSGTGESAYRFAVEHPESRILGVDVHDASSHVFGKAAVEFPDMPPPTNLSFASMGKVGSSHAIAQEAPHEIDRSILRDGGFDYCYSWCVFEHVDKSIIDPTFRDIYFSLKRGGVMYIKINPLFYSQRGSHFSSFLPEPWAHLIYEPKLLKNLYFEAAKGNVASSLVWHQYQTLNRITADELVDHIRKAGFTIVYEKRLYEGAPSAALKATYDEEWLCNKDVVLVCTK